MVPSEDPCAFQRLSFHVCVFDEDMASVLERWFAMKWFFFLSVLLSHTNVIEAVSKGSLLHGSALPASDLRFHSSRRIHDALTAIHSAKVEPHSASEGIQENLFPQLQMPSVAESRRQLLEKQNTTCAWDDETSSCSLSGSAVFRVLEQTDNPVSNYLQDVLVRYDVTHSFILHGSLFRGAASRKTRPHAAKEIANGMRHCWVRKVRNCRSPGKAPAATYRMRSFESLPLSIAYRILPIS